MSATAGFDPAPPVWEVASTAGMAAFDALAPEWLQLWKEHGDVGTPFVHPLWIRAHVAAMEVARNLHLITARRGGELRAVLPLIRDRGWYYGLPVRRLRSAAGVFGVRFDLCAAPGEAGRAAAAAIGHYLCQQRGWDVIELRDAPAGAVAEALIASAGAVRFPVGSWSSIRSPYLELDPEAHWERAIRSHYRYAMRRTRRHLQETGEPGGSGLRLARVVWFDPAQLQAQLNDYYRLEAAGWKGRNGSDISSRPGARAFYDQACAAMAAAGCLVLHRLELDGRLVAMACGLSQGQSYYLLKWSYDEAYAKFGAGLLLAESMLHECGEAGVRRFDFTGDHDPYKTRWTKTSLPHYWLYVFRPSAFGRCLLALKIRWAPRARRWLKRNAAEPRSEPL